MEQEIAILIADLSGYTALTEVHGSSAAADMIERYIGIVDSSLVGSSKLHQRVGDEVVIVSESADHLICTAVMLLQKCSSESNFLQLHGGLHFGKLLKRQDNYFGSTINIASRIAGLAGKGTFWCSESFINALSNKYAYTFIPRGMQQFKNVSEEYLLYELNMTVMDKYHIDPVCRMLIQDPVTAIKTGKPEIYFCSTQCRDIYTASNKV